MRVWRKQLNWRLTGRGIQYSDLFASKKCLLYGPPLFAPSFLANPCFISIAVWISITPLDFPKNRPLLGIICNRFRLLILFSSFVSSSESSPTLSGRGSNDGAVIVWFGRVNEDPTFDVPALLTFWPEPPESTRNSSSSGRYSPSKASCSSVSRSWSSKLKGRGLCSPLKEASPSFQHDSPNPPHI